MKKKNILMLLLSASIFVSVISSCSNNNQTPAEPAAAPVIAKTEDTAARGKYLVTIMGCNDCHSPKKMGPQGPEVIPALMMSGYPSDRPLVKFDSKLIKTGFPMFYPDLTAAAGPWGVSFAANLTPDASGIGNWTEEQFKKAFTQGKSKGMDGGRMLLPPMPWQDFAIMNNDDVHAIYVYLKTIPAVKNMVPVPVSPDKM